MPLPINSKRGLFNVYNCKYRVIGVGSIIIIIIIIIKVNQSRYRPGVAQRVPGS